MSKRIVTGIIPSKQIFVGEPGKLDREALCIFACLGFFLDQDTYYAKQKVLRPASIYEFDESGALMGDGKPWFKWYYEPRETLLKRVVTEFADLFEGIIADQVGNRMVILPLSGGLDSRTQAAALKHLGKKAHAYGYAFEKGHNETVYGRRIAEACHFPFEDWKVRKGYLWKSIGRLAGINGCYSEFTHPRSMAYIDQYAGLGEVFSLGHWGDVLFDDMRIPDDLPFEQQVVFVINKVVKKGGLELASALWMAWGLAGNFDDYLYERIKMLLAEIDIPHSANARIRAFKSLYWAPRWTAASLGIFESVRPITLPYFDNRMCQFICTVPERHLAKRQIQIEYLKLRAPELARIPWQEHRPFNLYTYPWDKSPWNLPFRVLGKAMRLANEWSGQRLIQRNWELQFVGEDNRRELRHYLLENGALEGIVPRKIAAHFLAQFEGGDSVRYSHVVSMLLTLSLFAGRKEALS